MQTRNSKNKTRHGQLFQGGYMRHSLIVPWVQGCMGLHASILLGRRLQASVILNWVDLATGEEGISAVGILFPSQRNRRSLAICGRREIAHLGASRESRESPGHGENLSCTHRGSRSLVHSAPTETLPPTSLPGPWGLGA